MNEKLIALGATLALLGLIHLVADWLIQTQETAQKKTHNRLARLWHSFTYSVWFIPCFFAWSTKVSLEMGIIGFLWVLVSHYFIDSYWPVYWWARYLRRMPEPNNPRYKEAWLVHPVNPVLFIAVDQILHVISLLPIAVLLVSR